MTISSLHYLVTHPKQAYQACRGGIDWIQLRPKDQSYDDWKHLAQDTLAVCRAFNARLIINDNPYLAANIGADGVHLGQDDMPVAEARRLLGDGFIIGGTANTLEHIRQHQRHGVNYVGLGPFRFARTKEKLSPVLGLAGYKTILSALRLSDVSLPVIAIGGITLDDVPALRQTGVYGIAVSSAIGSAAEPVGQTRLFCQSIASEMPKPLINEHL